MKVITPDILDKIDHLEKEFEEKHSKYLESIRKLRNGVISQDECRQHFVERVSAFNASSDYFEENWSGD